ncbi:MAG: ribosome maturation factor RimP, partial [Negativicoccus succinicivorans]|nr:ribosome maturation factor RimP [Negativicoccus succinicivorans]
MAQKKVAVRVEELAEPLVKAAGMELVDVEYVREQDWILRVYIDKEGGVD